MVGHLRDEKSPQTLFDAARLLAQRHDILIDHIGAPLDPALGRRGRSLRGRSCRPTAGSAHSRTGRRTARIQRAHVLVHASRMEGGAHVVMEAVCSGTPVIASRIPGNLGMLGADYPAVFAPGDAQGPRVPAAARARRSGYARSTCRRTVRCARPCSHRRASGRRLRRIVQDTVETLL